MVKTETIEEPKKIKISTSVQESVHETYSGIAKQMLSSKQASCCSSEDDGIIELKNRTEKIPSLGSDKDLMGFAKPQKGEVVVDLGSGPGKDALNFAREVGPEGKVIGIDFSDEMLTLANRHAFEAEIENVEFRKGTIENIPVEESTADLIISNCVINLSPNRQNVFNSAYQTLKPGGRIVFSDLVVKDSPSEELASNVDAVCGCYAGTTAKNYVEMLKKAGFKHVNVYDEYEFTKKFSGSEIEYTSSIFQGVK